MNKRGVKRRRCLRKVARLGCKIIFVADHLAKRVKPLVSVYHIVNVDVFIDNFKVVGYLFCPRTRYTKVFNRININLFATKNQVAVGLINVVILCVATVKVSAQVRIKRRFARAVRFKFYIFVKPFNINHVFAAVLAGINLVCANVGKFI